jgi:hypothetical protein
MIETRLEMTRGDTTTLDVLVVDDEGAVVDISGTDIRFTAKRDTSDTDAEAIFAKVSGDGISLVNGGTTGQCTVVIEPEDTEDLVKQTRLAWDIQFTDVAGAVKTAARGTLNVLMDVSVTSP